MEDRKPNILCIMSDEHDAALMGCVGDPVVRTPNLDALAGRGFLFDACYTPSPLCVPARLSFTAGKYISRCGAWSNASWLPSDDVPSLPRVLAAAGYEPWLGGKMHYDRTRRYGFRELYPSSQNAFVKTGRGLRRAPDDTRVNFESWRRRSANFYVAEDSHVMSLDREVTERCSRFLLERRRDDPPFFLLAGYLAPHFPLIVPERYWTPYRGRVPMPHIPDGLLEALPTNYQHLRRGFGLTHTNPCVVREGRELYWAFCEWLDNQIGRLLNALAHSDVAQDTVVIYTSDHGENKGDHGLWWKNAMYEHAARVPLIVSWPARWPVAPDEGPRRRAGACSLLDLVQTIVELAGAEAPDDWDGDSMLAWMDDPRAPWKDRAVSEYYGHNVASGYAMLRRGQMKYVYHTCMAPGFGPERELYDLAADPAELRNLARDRWYEAVVRTMHADLVAELGREPDETEALCRADYARGYVRPD